MQSAGYLARRMSSVFGNAKMTRAWLDRVTQAQNDAQAKLTISSSDFALGPICCRRGGLDLDRRQIS